MAFHKKQYTDNVKYPLLPQLGDDENHQDESRHPSFRTPKATRANSSKKRGHPSLARAKSSPSHRVRVANIFSDAADQLKVMSLSRAKPWIRKASEKAVSPLAHRTGRPGHTDEHCGPLGPLRRTHTESSGSGGHLPLLRGDGAGAVDAEPRPAPSRRVHWRPGKEPISSGFTSPTGAAEQTSLALPSPAPAIHPLYSLSEDEAELALDAKEIHSTHVVPPVLPIRRAPAEITALPPPSVHANIHAWLDGVLAPDQRPWAPGLSHPLRPFHANPTPALLQHRPRTRSNKENIPPLATDAATGLPSRSSNGKNSRGRNNDDDSSPSDAPSPRLGPCTDVAEDALPLLEPSRPRTAPRKPLRELPMGPASSPVKGRSGTAFSRAHAPPRSPGGLMALAPRRKRPRTASPPERSDDELAERATKGDAVGLSCMKMRAGASRRTRWPTRVPRDGGNARDRSPSEEGEIRDDEDNEGPSEDGILPLSSTVQTFRKGKGPTPDRRPSYWDRDILDKPTGTTSPSRKGLYGDE